MSIWCSIHLSSFHCYDEDHDIINLIIFFIIHLVLVYDDHHHNINSSSSLSSSSKFINVKISKSSLWPSSSPFSVQTQCIPIIHRINLPHPFTMLFSLFRPHFLLHCKHESFPFVNDAYHRTTDLKLTPRWVNRQQDKVTVSRLAAQWILFSLCELGHFPGFGIHNYPV